MSTTAKTPAKTPATKKTPAAKTPAQTLAAVSAQADIDRRAQQSSANALASSINTVEASVASMATETNSKLAALTSLLELVVAAPVTATPAVPDAPAVAVPAHPVTPVHPAHVPIASVPDVPVPTANPQPDWADMGELALVEESERQYVRRCRAIGKREAELTASATGSQAVRAQAGERSLLASWEAFCLTHGYSLDVLPIAVRIPATAAFRKANPNSKAKTMLATEKKDFVEHCVVQSFDKTMVEGKVVRTSNPRTLLKIGPEDAVALAASGLLHDMADLVDQFAGEVRVAARPGDKPARKASIGTSASVRLY